MDWVFPTTVPCDIQLAHRHLWGCVLISYDESTFTVEFDLTSDLGRTCRARGQFKLDSILSITYRAPSPIQVPTDEFDRNLRSVDSSA